MDGRRRYIVAAGATNGCVQLADLSIVDDCGSPISAEIAWARGTGSCACDATPTISIPGCGGAPKSVQLIGATDAGNDVPCVNITCTKCSSYTTAACTAPTPIAVEDMNQLFSKP